MTRTRIIVSLLLVNRTDGLRQDQAICVRGASATVATDAVRSVFGDRLASKTIIEGRSHRFPLNSRGDPRLLHARALEVRDLLARQQGA